MAYYVFSAEIPSALLRGKLFPDTQLIMCLFFVNILHSQDWTHHFLLQLNHGHRYLVRFLQTFYITLEKPIS